MDEKTKGLSPLYGIELLSQRAEMYKVLAQLYFRPLSSEQVNALSEQDWKSLTRDSACACPVAPPKAFAFVQDLIFGQGPKAPSHMRGSFRFSVYRVAWRLYIGLLGQAW